jgi:hypothetical protein
VVAVLGVIAAYGVVNPSWASAATLTGSNFEIDDDANLVVDEGGIDWLNTAGTAMRDGVEVGDDKPTGQTDDSFTQGTNINDTPTTITTGSIPNNKSDLTHFGIYVDKAGSEPFVDVFWTRVQAPHGTTTMDFEFNQSAVRQNDISPPGNTDVDTHTIPLRTDGDILVTYFLEAGGTHPTLTWRKWSGSAWGTATAFTATDALGAINATKITTANGLGTLDPFTFGEASLRLGAFVPPSDSCTTFGSVYLRSRSSATDTDENKDFIAPKPVNISNCGSIKIHKTDDNGVLAGAGFTVYKDVSPFGGSRSGADTVVAGTCTTGADGECTVSDLKVGHYWVVETTVPAGHDPAPDTATEVTAPDTTVTVNLNDPIQHGHIIVIKDAVPNDPQDFTFSLDSGAAVTLDDDPVSATPNSHDYTVVVGEHSLSETNIPAGWVNTGLVCDDNNPTSVSKPTAVVNVSKNETVTCTYTDTYTPTAPGLATQANVTQANTTWTDTATLTGDGTHAVTGSVAFYLCGPTASAASCAVGTQVGGSVDVINGSATSASTSPAAAGNYCFRAVFTSGSPYYTGASHSNDTTECFLKRNANLTVSKTATPAFGRAYTWDISKEVVGDDSVQVPAGTTHSFDYKVTVTHSSTDASWTVTGQITVTNPNGVAFTGVDVSDSIDNGAGTCSVPDGSNVTVPANDSVLLDYTCTYASAPSPATGTNTATATWDGAGFFTTASSASGTAAVDFDAIEPSTTDQVVTVADTLEGDLGTLDGATAENPTVFTYSIEQTAPDGTCTTFPNTASVATIRPVAEGLQVTQEAVTLDSASASVELCGGLPLGIDATAGGSFDREFLWLIDKSVDNTTITNSNGQTATFNYTVSVTPNGTADSGYALSGTVTVSNPNDWEDVVGDVTVASDLGGGVSCTVVDGENATIPKGDGKSFAYSCTFTGTPALTGTVTATVDWDAAAAATTDATASKVQPVSLVVATETNRTITVTDDKTDPANPVQLGTATYDDGAATFTYSLTKAGSAGTAAGPVCVDYTNIATIVETEQSDSQVVSVCHTFTGGGGGPVVAPPAGGGLPFTGDALGLLARTALALIGSGLVLMVLSRKRRRTA